MTKLTLSSYLNERLLPFEAALVDYIDSLSAPASLKKAMSYSLQAGGKRLRPMLLFATAEGFSGDFQQCLPVAAAIEMIHTYSLIHDDLPAMDNDDLRRGKPTNHKVFGEAQAILAGDALLTFAFQIIATMEEKQLTAGQKLRIISELAKAAGPEGMVAGQVGDMEAEQKNSTLAELEYIHHHKTGDILSFSIISGAIIGNANEKDVVKLREFAKHVGLAFQIKDDILDIEGHVEKLGKPVGSDLDNEKSTYPKLLGLEGAKQKLAHHISQGKKYLSEVEMDDEKLLLLVNYIVERDH